MHALNLKDLTLERLAQTPGMTPARAQAAFRAMYRDGVRELDGLGVSRRWVDAWRDRAIVPERVPEVSPSGDGSRKLLFRNDEGSFESVIIPHARRSTVCVSSQMGCALDCAFCLTGLLTLKRNLRPWEIVEQVLQAKRLCDGETPSNVVFMGMGEPLLNFDAVRDAVEILSSPYGLGIARAKITVSTAGYVPNILRWAKEVGTHLAVSIIAATDEKRSMLMSINRRFPLDELWATIDAYTELTGKRVLCEYLLIRDLTDTDEDVAALAEKAKGRAVTLNLIPYNENDRMPYRRPGVARVEEFKRAMIARGVFTTVRWSHGGDIGAACGQLSALGPSGR